MEIQEGAPRGLLCRGVTRIIANTSSRGASAGSSRGPCALVSSSTMREAVAESVHEVVHLVLQGLRVLPADGLRLLQDHTKAEARLVKRSRVAEQAEVGEDQPARLGE